MATGNARGPSTDSRARPRSLFVLRRRHCVESAGFPCIGHEPWSAPCAHVQTMSVAEAPTVIRKMLVPAATHTWSNSHDTASGTRRHRILDTDVDQLNHGYRSGSSRALKVCVAAKPCIDLSRCRAVRVSLRTDQAQSRYGDCSAIQGMTTSSRKSTHARTSQISADPLPRIVIRRSLRGEPRTIFGDRGSSITPAHIGHPATAYRRTHHFKTSCSRSCNALDRRERPNRR